MFCAKCGTLNADDAKFCTSCGVLLSAGTFGITTPPPPNETEIPPVYPALQHDPQANYGGFWRRVAASLIDGIVTWTAFSLLGFAIGLLAHPTTKSGIESLENLMQIISTVGIWLYYTLCESSACQATIGKQAMGIKVTDLTGKRITFIRATCRYLAKILSATMLCIGFILVAFTAKKQGLHDLLASTLVIRKPG